MPDSICLWLFPESDFSAWKNLTGDAMKNYREYADTIVAVQADLERQGHAVLRVRATVAELRAMLESKNLPNTPDGRAAAIAFLSGEK